MVLAEHGAAAGQALCGDRNGLVESFEAVQQLAAVVEQVERRRRVWPQSPLRDREDRGDLGLGGGDLAGLGEVERQIGDRVERRGVLGPGLGDAQRHDLFHARDGSHAVAALVGDGCHVLADRGLQLLRGFVDRRHGGSDAERLFGPVQVAEPQATEAEHHEHVPDLGVLAPAGPLGELRQRGHRLDHFAVAPLLVPDVGAVCLCEQRHRRFGSEGRGGRVDRRRRRAFGVGQLRQVGIDIGELGQQETAGIVVVESAGEVRIGAAQQVDHLGLGAEAVGRRGGDGLGEEVHRRLGPSLRQDGAPAPVLGALPECQRHDQAGHQRHQCEGRERERTAVARGTLPQQIERAVPTRRDRFACEVAAQLGAQFAGTLVALVGGLLEAVGDDRLQIVRGLWAVSPHRHRRALDDRHQHRMQSARDRERHHAGQRAVEHHAERPHVAARVDRIDLATRLLGAAPLQRAEEDRGGTGVAAGQFVDAAVEVLGEAEVEHLRRALPVEADVARLEVAMHDAAPVRAGDAVADLGQQRDDAVARRRVTPIRGPRLHVGRPVDGRSVDQFHDQEPAAVVGGATVEDAHHVGMIEAGQQLEFAFEATALVACAQRRQQFDRDDATRGQLAAGVDDTLTTAGQLAQFGVAVQDRHRGRCGLSQLVLELCIVEEPGFAHGAWAATGAAGFSLRRRPAPRSARAAGA